MNFIAKDDIFNKKSLAFDMQIFRVNISENKLIENLSMK